MEWVKEREELDMIKGVDSRIIPYRGTRAGEDPAMQDSQLAASLGKPPQECELCFRRPSHRLPAPGCPHNHTFHLEVSALYLRSPQDPA